MKAETHQLQINCNIVYIFTEIYFKRQCVTLTPENLLYNKICRFAKTGNSETLDWDGKGNLCSLFIVYVICMFAENLCSHTKA